MHHLAAQLQVCYLLAVHRSMLIADRLQVSRAVHQLIGGEVEHIGTDEEDLNDHDKMLNRLYALNLLEISGFAPIVTLWQVGRSQ